MSKLTPIPIPLRQRWQDFRFQALPFLACGATLFAVIYLWQEESAPASMAGEVEAVVSEVTSPGAGTLSQLRVARFEEVEAGADLGEIITTPPDILHASFAVLKAEIELTRLGWIDPFLDQQRNALQLESLKLDWMDERATLAIRTIELRQAERDYERARRLIENQTVSQDEYERARNRFKVLEETVGQLEDIVEAMQRSIETLGVERGDDDFAPAALQATLELQKERLRLKEAELRPARLVAPISGTVMMLHRRNGEHVVEGDPILSIQSDRAERIVAYLRQPLSIEPSVGMEVEIGARNMTRQRISSEIIFVGPQMEELSPAFRQPFLEQYESGLPVVIGMPAGLNLRPGELVDVTLLP